MPPAGPLGVIPEPRAVMMRSIRPRRHPIRPTGGRDDLRMPYHHYSVVDERLHMTMQECPLCGSTRVDEYTHYECPAGSTPEDHRHLVCANTSCNHEWTEPLPS